MLNTVVMTKIIIHKPANEVFEAIVSPEKIGKFWFSSSSERWEKGKRILLRYEEYNAKGVITVLKMENNQKIVFSWGEEHGEGTVVPLHLQSLSWEQLLKSGNQD